MFNKSVLSIAGAMFLFALPMYGGQAQNDFSNDQPVTANEMMKRKKIKIKIKGGRCNTCVHRHRVRRVRTCGNPCNIDPCAVVRRYAPPYDGPQYDGGYNPQYSGQDY